MVYIKAGCFLRKCHSKKAGFFYYLESFFLYKLLQFHFGFLSSKPKLHIPKKALAMMGQKSGVKQTQAP